MAKGRLSDVKHSNVKGIGRLLSLHHVDIDGDLFLVTVPTVTAWTKMMKFIEYDKEIREIWEYYWKDAGVTKVIVQEEYAQDGAFPCFATVNDFSCVCMENISERDSDLALGFIPALIPLKTPELVYDKNLMAGSPNGLRTLGGTFRVNGQEQATRGKFLNGFIVNGDTVSNLSFSDTIDSEFSDYVLPWMHIDGILIGMRCLGSNFSMCDLFKVFNPFG